MPSQTNNSNNNNYEAAAVHSKSDLRLEFLDGIRGWGALMVFLYHLIIQLLSNTAPSYKSKYLAFLLDGEFAVFIFFVLSGFVLSIKFVITPGKYSLTQASIARYFRLMIPIIITSFFAYLLMLAHAMHNVPAAIPANARHWLGVYFNFEPTLAFFLQFNFYGVFFKFNHSANFNPVLWTISHEFAGSMLVYLMIGFFRTEKNKTYLIPIISIVLFFLFNKPIIACFAIGYLLAELYVAYSQRLSTATWVSWLATAVFAVPVICSTFYRTGHHLYIALLASLLVLSVSFSKPLKYFFSNRLSLFLGKISFPLYLIHMPLVCSYSAYLFLYLPAQGYGNQATANIIVATTVPLGLIIAKLFYPIEPFSVKAAKRISEVIMRVPLIKRH